MFLSRDENPSPVFLTLIAAKLDKLLAWRLAGMVEQASYSGLQYGEMTWVLQKAFSKMMDMPSLMASAVSRGDKLFPILLLWQQPLASANLAGPEPGGACLLRGGKDDGTIAAGVVAA